MLQEQDSGAEGQFDSCWDEQGCSLPTLAPLAPPPAACCINALWNKQQAGLTPLRSAPARRTREQAASHAPPCSPLHAGLGRHEVEGEWAGVRLHLSALPSKTIISNAWQDAQTKEQTCGLPRRWMSPRTRPPTRVEARVQRLHLPRRLYAAVQYAQRGGVCSGQRTEHARNGSGCGSQGVADCPSCHRSQSPSRRPNQARCQALTPTRAVHHRVLRAVHRHAARRKAEVQQQAAGILEARSLHVVLRHRNQVCGRMGGWWAQRAAAWARAALNLGLHHTCRCKTGLPALVTGRGTGTPQHTRLPLPAHAPALCCRPPQLSAASRPVTALLPC